jgi:phage-related protein
LYTEAYCAKLSNVKDLMEGVIEADVTFELKPFWYFDTAIEVFDAPTHDNYILQNPTDYVSYPRIKVQAFLNDATLGIIINSKNITIPVMSGANAQEVIYDSESGDVIVNGNNFNYLINNYDYPPNFGKGQNTVRFNNATASGILPYVLIEPRWKLL